MAVGFCIIPAGIPGYRQCGICRQLLWNSSATGNWNRQHHTEFDTYDNCTIHIHSNCVSTPAHQHSHANFDTYPYAHSNPYPNIHSATDENAQANSHT